MATEIDGVLMEWGDRLYRTKPKARPARQVVTVTGRRQPAPKVKLPGQSAAAIRATIARTTRKTPEVMVKITQGKQIDPETKKREITMKNMGAIKAHMDYVSRNGEVVLETDEGWLVEGKEAVRELRDEWRHGGGHYIPVEGGVRREAINIVLSMPPGTDRAAVKDAAREFAAANFPNNAYFFAAHDDEDHPHVHLCVRAVGRDLRRLNPRKADLQRWRQSFAEKLRDNGIEANATTRSVRGQVRKSEHQAVRNIQKKRRGRSRVAEGRARDVAAAVKANGGPVHPAEVAVKRQRNEVLKNYAALARTLAQGDGQDHKSAMDIMSFVSGLPEPKTAHRAAVELGIASGREGQGRPPEGGVKRDVTR